MTMPKLRVRTNHSEYIIDQEAGLFSRQTVHERANPIDGFNEAEWHKYDEVYLGPEVGQPLVIFMPGGRWIRSTLVQSVEELS